MKFHWTVASFVMLSGFIPLFISVIMSIKGYFQYKYRSFLFMALSWGFMGLGNFVIACGYILMDFRVYKIGVLLSIPLGYAIIFLFDSISRDSFSTSKIVIMSILSTALIIFGLEPDVVIENVTGLGEHTPAMTGFFQITGSLVFLFAGLLWLFYMIKIYRNAPLHLKKMALFNLIGSVIAGPGSIIAFGSGFVWLIPGTDYVLIGIGALICTYCFYRQPKLGYVLPFVVYRLQVIQVSSGLPLYEYTWTPLKLNNQTLFSAAIKGVSSILKESLGKWEMREILFDKGMLIFEYDSKLPIAFILISSKSTAIMRQGLTLFKEKFIKNFEAVLGQNIAELSQFENAEKLIQDSFPFVVHRK